MSIINRKHSSFLIEVWDAIMGVLETNQLSRKNGGGKRNAKAYFHYNATDQDNHSIFSKMYDSEKSYKALGFHRSCGSSTEKLTELLKLSGKFHTKHLTVSNKVNIKHNTDTH